MKLALLSYENKEIRLDGTDMQNLGDWIQVIAVEKIFQEWGIDDYIRISRNCLDEYNGERVKLLFNGWNSFSELSTYRVRQFPILENIDPVFFSFNMEGNYIPLEVKKQLKKYGPIGCRDEGTFFRLQRQGIPVYISGCVTSLLPKRKCKKEKQTKTIFVDIPVSFKEYIPQEVMKEAEFRTNIYRITRTTGEKRMTKEESEEAYKMANEQLLYLQNNAKLVVTSRLHIASPCIAMGIPVIVVKDNFDDRFAWLDKYVKLYEKAEWNKIDWRGTVVNFETEKNKMKNILKKMFFVSQSDEEGEMYFSYYYGTRNKQEYNTILKKGLENIKTLVGSKCIYSLCGVSIDTITFQNVIGEILPEWNLKEVYDNHIIDKRYFEGHEIKKLQTDNYKDIIYMITTRKAQKYAVDILKKNDCRYVVVDYENPYWENNIV